GFVQEAIGRGKQDHEDAVNHDPREEVRQVGDGLDALLEWPPANLVDEQGKQDPGGQSPEEAIGTDQQCISEDIGEIRTLEHLLEMFETDPWAARDALEHLVILEGDDSPVHGEITENGEVDDTGDDHQ